MKRKLYLFDFDGTITNVDTLFSFLKFSFPDQYFKKWIIFLPNFILVKLKIMKADKIKEKFISSFMKGMHQSEIEQLSKKYFKANSHKIIYPNAESYLKNINNYNDKYIVSASLDLWLKPFADYFGMGLICTRAEIDENGYFTGKFKGKNCNYKEKKNRIEKEIDLKLYDESLSFGDSRGDEAMFSITTHSYKNYFDR